MRSGGEPCLYENTAATDRRLAFPLASALRPTGPAAMETLPPRDMLPVCANVLTAFESLRIITKSVISAPSWPPKPALRRGQ